MTKKTFYSALGAGMSASGECYIGCLLITLSVELAILVVVVVVFLALS